MNAELGPWWAVPCAVAYGWLLYHCFRVVLVAVTKPKRNQSPGGIYGWEESIKPISFSDVHNAAMKRASAIMGLYFRRMLPAVGWCALVMLPACMVGTSPAGFSDFSTAAATGWVWRTLMAEAICLLAGLLAATVVHGTWWHNIKYKLRREYQFPRDADEAQRDASYANRKIARSVLWVTPFFAGFSLVAIWASDGGWTPWILGCFFVLYWIGCLFAWAIIGVPF